MSSAEESTAAAKKGAAGRSKSPAPDAGADGAPKAEGEASAASAPAAAKAVPAKIPARKPAPPPMDEDDCCSGTCCMIVIIVLCLVFFAIVGLAYFSVWPMSMIRPFFFGSPYALTKDTWDAKVAGRTVFIKFYAPWCGHCKAMAADWDKLAAQHVDHSFLTVADVDCTGGGKSLCEELGIQGFPTLKYGDPNNLLDYKGARKYDELNKFASGLEPTCGPDQLQSCSADQKKLIEEFQAMGAEVREAKIKEQEAEIESLNANFKNFIEQLNAEYKEATSKKDDAVKEVKETGLSMLKAVVAHEASGGDAKKGDAKTEL